MKQDTLLKGFQKNEVDKTSQLRSRIVCNGLFFLASGCEHCYQKMAAPGCIVTSPLPIPKIYLEFTSICF